MTTTTAKPNRTSSATESLAGRVAEATEAATGVAREATDAATDVAREAVGSAAVVVREADRTLRDSPDETLGMVGALSVGIAIGMVATNAPRLLIAAALVPAAFVAWVYLQRRNLGTRAESK